LRHTVFLLTVAADNDDVTKSQTARKKALLKLASTILANHLVDATYLFADLHSDLLLYTICFWLSPRHCRQSGQLLSSCFLLRRWTLTS